MNDVAADRIAHARGVKAGRLIAWFKTRRFTAEQVANDALLREEAVIATKVREPSETTWKLVVSTLHHLEQNPAPADPFEGL